MESAIKVKNTSIMNTYKDYIQEIEESQGLNRSQLMEPNYCEIISQIKI
jgi:hypothetical protein